MRLTIRSVLVLLVVTTPCAVHADVDLADIMLPPGFSIDVYADVPHARSMAMGDDGTIFVANRSASSIYAVVPLKDGSTEVVKLASGLATPNGVAYHDGDLYVAEISRVLRFENVASRLRNMPKPEVLDVELPAEKMHGWRYISFGPDGRLYLAIGAPCNVCDRGAEGYGQIIRMSPDGTGREMVADGIRNSVGLAWHPDTGELWFTDNGRDMLGDDIPPDELNRSVKPRLHFGFPYCHAGDIPDPEFGSGKNCEDFTPPVQKLGSHVAPLGLKFYNGEMFPADYKGQIFIAEHGSWNRSKKIGYRISLVRLEDGEPVSYEVFADGWLQGESVSGRPVDILELDDGSLLVSDDHAGKIYRISYAG